MSVHRHLSGREGTSDSHNNAALSDRSNYKTINSINSLWDALGLPSSALSSLSLPDADQPALPSSFKIGHLAQTSIGLSALAAALNGAARNQHAEVPKVTVPLRHTVVEFMSERFHVVDGQEYDAASRTVIGGLHEAKDGYVRIHDGFPNHRDGALRLLGLEPGVGTREDMQEKVRDWPAVELEEAAVQSKVVIAALRSYEEWDDMPQARAVANMPVSVRRAGLPRLPKTLRPADRCLEGLRVVEMTRVIAAPVAGRTLAAHGADVVWVVSPSLPYLPAIDRDFSRGKRIVSLDAKDLEDKKKLLELLRDADVFLQGFRPGALEGLGLGKDTLRELNPDLIVASMSAFGDRGPWAGRRGFDSIVQTCSGMNVSEAEHHRGGQAAKPMPCQALDHGGGYLLAFGIMAAVYKRATEGGAYDVDVSLAGVMKYLRSLGQYEGNSGFEVKSDGAEYIEQFMETRDSGFGELKAVRHSAAVEGFRVGWDIMPEPPKAHRVNWR